MLVDPVSLSSRHGLGKGESARVWVGGWSLGLDWFGLECWEQSTPNVSMIGEFRWSVELSEGCVSVMGVYIYVHNTVFHMWQLKGQ
jgi:hypothetical protein